MNECLGSFKVDPLAPFVSLSPEPVDQGSESPQRSAPQLDSVEGVNSGLDQNAVSATANDIHLPNSLSHEHLPPELQMDPESESPQRSAPELDSVEGVKSALDQNAVSATATDIHLPHSLPHEPLPPELQIDPESESPQRSDPDSNSVEAVKSALDPNTVSATAADIPLPNSHFPPELQMDPESESPQRFDPDSNSVKAVKPALDPKVDSGTAPVARLATAITRGMIITDSVTTNFLN
jgi:hypothetical protein